MIYDVAIVGAGAGGLMAASFLNNFNVCIIDSNEQIGAKIRVSGGAKCNITNSYLSSDYYKGDKDFIDNTFSIFNNKDLLHFLNKNGVYPKIDEKIVKGTYFCNSSKDVINMFTKLTRKCHFKLSNKVLDVDYKDNYYEITTNKQKIKSKKLIIASGGLSYSSLGASSIGFDIAKKFGHTISKLDPALVGFTVQKEQFWFKELSGLSLDVKIKIGDKNIKGKLLFTHKGCSGPAVLSSSLYWDKGSIKIDFKPDKNSYLPKRFKQAIKDIKDIDIHNYEMAPAGNFGYSKAEVTKGGVSLSEIDNNFESKLQKGLFFLGEVLDVTGELGGYNFQWAFSSAYVMSKNIKKVS